MPHSQPDVLIKRVLGEAGQAVSFADMAVLGRNPARIIPAICRFTDSRHPRRTRFLDEPVWAGRSPAETTEATRHEALINAALAAVPTSVMCPYDASGLAAAVLADARHTHPRVVEDGARRPSAEYSGTAVARAIGGYGQDKHKTHSGPALPCVRGLARPRRRVWPPEGLPVL